MAIEDEDSHCAINVTVLSGILSRCRWCRRTSKFAATLPVELWKSQGGSWKTSTWACLESKVLLTKQWRVVKQVMRYTCWLHSMFSSGAAFPEHIHGLMTDHTRCRFMPSIIPHDSFTMFHVVGYWLSPMDFLTMTLSPWLGRSGPRCESLCVCSPKHGPVSRV